MQHSAVALDEAPAVISTHAAPSGAPRTQPVRPAVHPVRERRWARRPRARQGSALGRVALRG